MQTVCYLNCIKIPQFIYVNPWRNSKIFYQLKTNFPPNLYSIHLHIHAIHTIAIQHNTEDAHSHSHGGQFDHNVRIYLLILLCIAHNFSCNWLFSKCTRKNAGAPNFYATVIYIILYYNQVPQTTNSGR